MRTFLISRRAKITPSAASVPVAGQRRVPGLRRSEVAALAGISVGVKTFHHHVVGDLTLAYESMDLRAEPDLTMTLYAAEPGSPTQDALRLLASWATDRLPTP